jgi:hypothetical protein
MPKRNVYFSDEDVMIWDKLAGNKSQLLRDFLLEYNRGKLQWKDMTEREQKREKLRHQILLAQKDEANLEKMYIKAETDFWALKDKIEKMIDEYESEYRAWDIDENMIIAADVWDVIYSEAESRIGTIFPSPSGLSQYRIQNAKKGKVMIERIDTPSPKPSTFTFRTIEKAIERLEYDGDGEKLERGLFMPVLAQECAAVFLHPSLSYEGKYLVFDRKDR